MKNWWLGGSDPRPAIRFRSLRHQEKGPPEGGPQGIEARFCLEIARHAAVRHGGRCFLLLRQLSHQGFGGQQQRGNRAGDFLVGDVTIHVTTSPGEAVIERCRKNLNDGYKPILVTIRSRIATAEGLADDNKGVADRVDIFEIEQFVALNLYELREFGAEGRRVAVDDLVTRYNEIVEDVETDPSLKIEIRQ